MKNCLGISLSGASFGEYVFESLSRLSAVFERWRLSF